MWFYGKKHFLIALPRIISYVYLLCWIFRGKSDATPSFVEAIDSGRFKEAGSWRPVGVWWAEWQESPRLLGFPEVYQRIVTEETKGGVVMSKGKGVSGHTHTRQQLNDYANQHNPNNPAYRADQENQARMASTNRKDQKYWLPDYDYSYALDKDDY